MRLLDLSTKKFPLDNVFAVPSKRGSIYNVFVQRFRAIARDIALTRDRLNDLDAKLIDHELTSEEIKESEVLENVLFNYDLSRKGQRYILSGGDEPHYPTLEHFKDLIREKRVLRVERYGNLDEYSVSNAGQIYTVSETDFKKLLVNLGSHMNMLLKRMSREGMDVAEISNLPERDIPFMSDEEQEQFLEEGAIPSPKYAKLQQVKRVEQFAKSFYAAYFCFPNCHVTFCDLQGKPIFYDSGALPDFVDREIVPTTERSDACGKAILPFHQEITELLAKYAS
ncbi:MAG: hypothetical protein ACMXX5_01395 [Candidatus Woesearchaeota archaeon]